MRNSLSAPAFACMEIYQAIDTLDDVLKLKCHKAIAAIQRTLDLYGCAECGALCCSQSWKRIVSGIELARAEMVLMR